MNGWISNVTLQHVPESNIPYNFVLQSYIHKMSLKYKVDKNRHQTPLFLTCLKPTGGFYLFCFKFCLCSLSTCATARVSLLFPQLLIMLCDHSDFLITWCCVEISGNFWLCTSLVLPIFQHPAVILDTLLSNFLSLSSSLPSWNDLNNIRAYISNE